MNGQDYKQRLLDMERTLASRIGRAVGEGRQEFIDSAHDVGEASVADEVASEEFTEAGLDSNVLAQVRDALVRVEEGTFGACVVDGKPIESKRLDAVPWTPYCLAHEQARETSSGMTTPTL